MQTMQMSRHLELSTQTESIRVLKASLKEALKQRTKLAEQLDLALHNSEGYKCYADEGQRLLGLAKARIRVLEGQLSRAESFDEHDSLLAAKDQITGLKREYAVLEGKNKRLTNFDMKFFNEQHDRLYAAKDQIKILEARCKDLKRLAANEVPWTDVTLMACISRRDKVIASLTGQRDEKQKKIHDKLLVIRDLYEDLTNDKRTITELREEVVRAKKSLEHEHSESLRYQDLWSKESKESATWCTLALDRKAQIAVLREENAGLHTEIKERNARGTGRTQRMLEDVVKYVDGTGSQGIAFVIGKNLAHACQLRKRVARMLGMHGTRSNSIRSGNCRIEFISNEERDIRMRGVRNFRVWVDHFVSDRS